MATNPEQILRIKRSTGTDAFCYSLEAHTINDTLNLGDERLNIFTIHMHGQIGCGKLKLHSFLLRDDSILDDITKLRQEFLIDGKLFFENLAAFILCLFLLSLASKERISNDGSENY